MQGRNRRCITVDMRQEEGRKLIKQLANKVDVVVENFRPGVMEKWKLGPKVVASSQCSMPSVVCSPMLLTTHFKRYANSTGWLCYLICICRNTRTAVC